MTLLQLMLHVEEIRVKKNWTKKQISVMLDVSEGAIQKWSDGTFKSVFPCTKRNGF